MKVLAVAPVTDEASQISYKWCLKAIEEARKEGVSVTLLEKDQATRENFERLIPEHYIFAFWDHGLEDCLGSAKGSNPALVDLKNNHLLANKEVWTMACLSADILGPDTIQRGAKFYQGYNKPFVFSPLPGIEEMFGEAANKGFIERIKNHSFSRCKASQKTKFLQNIKNLVLLGGSGIIFAVFLAYDLAALRYLGGGK